MADRFYRVLTAYGAGGGKRTKTVEVRETHLCSAVLKGTRTPGFDHIQITRIAAGDREVVARAGGKDQ